MPRYINHPICAYLITHTVLFLLLTEASAADTLRVTLENSTVPFFGTKVYTLATGIGGGFAAFAYAGESSRVKLFAVAVTNGFLATALVTVAPFWFNWEWILNLEGEKRVMVEPPLAFVLAFVLRWAVQLFIELGPAWARKKWGQTPGDQQ